MLYGHDRADLDRVVDRVLGSDLVVPLIGIAGACDQPYTAAAVLATERTIAYALERLTTRQGHVVAADVVERVTVAKETELGHRLSAGQRRAVERICGSGRAVDVIVGVAGSGKTTASTLPTGLWKPPAIRCWAPPPVARRPALSATRLACRPGRCGR